MLIKYNKMRVLGVVTVLLLLLGLSSAAIHLQIVNLASSTGSYTITFPSPLTGTPVFAYYIESGRITGTEFAITHDPALTSISTTSFTIHFTLHHAILNSFEHVFISLLMTDQNSEMVNFGILQLQVASRTLTFSGFSLQYTNSTLEIYPNMLPMNYTKISNATTRASNQLILTVSTHPATYFVQGTVFFSYIYITNAYAAIKMATLFSLLNEQFFGYLLNYHYFVFRPSNDNTMIAMKTFTSNNGITFFDHQAFKDFTSLGSQPDEFIIGYQNKSNLYYTADVLMVNTTGNACPENQLLRYPAYFMMIPQSCMPCHLSCKTCLVPDTNNSAVTDQFSCTSCLYLRHFNPTTQFAGSCPCLPGLQVDSAGHCLPCDQSCLTFKVVYIESTNQTNFIVYFSYPDIVEYMSLLDNLQVTINGADPVSFEIAHQRSAIYFLNIPLSELAVCEGVPCNVKFLIKSPDQILTADLSRALSNDNVTVYIENYVNYQTILPTQVTETFKVIGMIVAGSYGAGYTGMLKMLFELNQMIDFHKYINLTMPVIFSQLVESLSSFKFMDLTLLLPDQPVDKIQNFPPNDLDQLGSPKLMFYEQGVNFAKNIFSGLISVAFMLLFNYLIYLMLKKLPFKFTHTFAKKLSKRKIITIFDTFDQLILPCFYFSMAQMFHILLKAELGWIYGMAFVLGAAVVVAPFLMILYIYSQRHNEQMVDVYEDLMQDNNMSMPITYVYFVFNYYRKIFFALALTSSVPGLVQVYLLITINISHLSFTIYLILTDVYRSKSKIIIKIVNSISMMILEVLIIIYNVNNYSNETNVKIGMACFYIAITTAILGIIDAIIKLIDTLRQQVGKKKTKKVEQERVKKKPVLKEFRKEVVCNLGEEIGPRPKDPKERKFKQDKQLMEHTFHPQFQSQSSNSDRVSAADNTRQHPDGLDLVYIDNDWMNVYPQKKEPSPLTILRRDEPEPFIHQEEEQLEIKDEKGIELYEIPASIDREARNLARRKKNQEERKRRPSKYEIDEEFLELPSRSTGRSFKKRQEEQGRESSYLKVNPIRQSQEELSEFDPND